jgi:alpha-D-xyloside xylohydrolase
VLRVSAGIRVALAALTASACGGGPVHGTVLRARGTFRIDVSPDARTISLARGADALLTLGPDAFQLGVVNKLDDQASYDPFWLEAKDSALYTEPPKDLRFLDVTSARVADASRDGESIAIEETWSSGLMATVEIRTSSASTDERASFGLRIVPHGTVPIAYVRVRAHASKDEAFYGLGEWEDGVEHRGKLRPMQIEVDGASESMDNEAHAPIPFLIGTRGWGVFVESRRYGLFDVARKADDLVEITYGTAAESPKGLTMHLFAAKQALDVTKSYYEITGNPRLPATWAFGPWIWRDENRDQAEVERDIRKIDLATSAIWIDRPYARAVNTFDFDAPRFPDPSAMIARARDAGLRMALWSTPYLEKAATPFVDEASMRGFFPPTTGLLLNHWGAPIDFTNVDAYAFWQSLIGRYATLGIEGYKLDYAEDVVAGTSGARIAWMFADGSDERTMHYGYTKLYHRVYAETLPATGGFLLCRAARWGEQTLGPIIWPGDLDATLTKHGQRFTPRGASNPVNGVGGLPASLIMALSLGPSGFPFFASDTGGYRHSPPDKETYVRWLEQTALSSVMEVGDSSSQPPWEFTADNGRDQATLDLYRAFARLHLRLFPYVWSYAERLAADGRAIMRPEGLVFPELGVHPNDVYLLGDALLVAPVVEPGVVMRSIAFPPGAWVDWESGERHSGGQGRGAEMIAAPLERLPLYVRAGALVPMLRPTIDTLSPVGTSTLAQTIESYTKDPGRLWVRTARGGDGAFTVFDGTQLEASEAGGLLTLRITPGGTFAKGALFEVISAGSSASDSIRIEIDGAEAARAASLDALERADSGWIATPDASTTIHIAVPPGTHEIRATLP